MTATDFVDITTNFVDDESLGLIRNSVSTVRPKPEVKKSSTKVSWQRGSYSKEAVFDNVPKYVSFMVNLAFSVMFFCGYFVDWLKNKKVLSVPKATDDPRTKNFPRLDNYFENIYINHIYRKSSDVIGRAVCSVPGSVLTLKDRVSDNYGWSFRYTGKKQKVINLGSYNYLGFSHNDGDCAQSAVDFIDKYGLHIGSTPHERGSHSAHREMERCIATYLGTEDSICFPMGFGTNAMNIHALVDKGSLILSDRLNHASIVLGCRISGATIKTFKHNDAEDCERVLRENVSSVSPKTKKPYNKVLIVIEGIYSMEGTIVNLPGFIEVKKKYGAYLFLDEAHSIGAVGPSGKGVTEYWGCDSRDIDIMMGTFTKSFAATGGYMAGKKTTIDYIRQCSSGPCYGIGMSPPVIAQIMSSMRIMLGQDNTDIGITKCHNLLRNSRYFRKRLRQMGFLIYGHDDSPVVPLLTYYITKVVMFSRSILERNVGVVAVGFPATSIDKARIRFCLSADHTKEQLDYVLDMVDQVGDETNTKYGQPEFQGEIIEY
ncbi:unnamed protein product [Auanema sp. JU1783]|nr:unnamed protein product [Auanema sp. JU1783]